MREKLQQRKSATFSYTFKNGVVFTPPAGTFSRYSAETLRKFDENDEIWFGKDGTSIPSRKTFLCDLKNVPVPADEFLDKVGMEENAKDTLICELSFEDKKRVQLAAFLVQKPYVILFDEPFDYCSENYIRSFLQVLQTVKENHIILISTGLLEIAKQISNEILLLHNGRFEVVPSETLQVQELRRAVLDIIGEADHGNL